MAAKRYKDRLPADKVYTYGEVHILLHACQTRSAPNSAATLDVLLFHGKARMRHAIFS